MRFLSRPELRPVFEGKSVAIVGSGPGCAGNPDGLVDSHEVVVRVNNYKITGGTGKRTDVFYSFFGNSILKKPEDLKADGVKLCMCKCPDAHVIESDWHRRKHRMEGVDYRYIYENRKDWWFCDTYIPAARDFLTKFNLLGQHIPTTGFAAILDVLDFRPGSVFLTGFDFFRSGKHNVDENWREKNIDDPHRHRPDKELNWIVANMTQYPLAMDAALLSCLKQAA